MAKASSGLYKMARKMNEMAAKMNDIEAIMSGDPKKIAKRLWNKGVYKNANKLANKMKMK